MELERYSENAHDALSLSTLKLCLGSKKRSPALRNL
jgi:hypothetical protein